MGTEQEIRALLQLFQDGYTRRDLTRVDSFMQLFTSDAVVIGTNGHRPGMDEWYTSRSAARELVEGDWQGWGDLRLDLDAASIHSCGDAGWVAIPCTVTSIIGDENYQSYLDYVKNYIETSPLPAEQKLHNILRGGTNTVYELRRGEKFVWALRLTAAVICEADGWKFAQLHFSHPTIYFPDVRLFD